MFRTNGTGFFSNHLWVESLLTRYQHTLNFMSRWCTKAKLMNVSTQWEKHYWSTIHCQLLSRTVLFFLHRILQMKPNQVDISVSSAWWPLFDRVDEKGRYNCPFFSTKLFHQDFDYRGWLVNRGSTAFEYHDQTKAHALIHCINCVSRLDWPL